MTGNTPSEVGNAGYRQAVLANPGLKPGVRYGDEIANELVEWFNQVDATYRADLRELNELNFARFDAKLEQRWAQLDAKLEQRIAEVRGDMEAGFARSDAKLELRLGELRNDLSGLKAELISWMFTFWATTTLILLGTMVALLKL